MPRFAIDMNDSQRLSAVLSSNQHLMCMLGDLMDEVRDGFQQLQETNTLLGSNFWQLSEALIALAQSQVSAALAIESNGRSGQPNPLHDKLPIADKSVDD